MARFGYGYPQKLLGNDEQVQFELRLALEDPDRAAIWLLVIIGAVAFPHGKGQLLVRRHVDDHDMWSSPSRPVDLIVLVIRPFLFWWTTQYVFTNRRIIIRTGIVARRGRDMPLSKVNDVSFRPQRVGADAQLRHALMIESAAENGQLIIENIPDVENVQREVYRLHDEDDAFRRARNSGIDPSPPTNES